MRRWVLVLLMAVGCAGPDSFPLPDRSDPVVRKEEARIAKVLEDDRSGRVLSSTAPRTCEVRLLRREGGTDYVWAVCTSSGPTGEGGSFPARVRGSEVTTPSDGSAYSTSIKEMFPEDIAEAVLEDPERYRP